MMPVLSFYLIQNRLFGSQVTFRRITRRLQRWVQMMQYTSHQSHQLFRRKVKWEETL